MNGRDMMPGVPAAGHLSGRGYWHSGTIDTCDACAEARESVSLVFGIVPRVGTPAGPVHAVSGRGVMSQAWCGARPQFRHRVRPGTASEVTCRRCLSALDRGYPYARGSR